MEKRTLEQSNGQFVKERDRQRQIDNTKSQTNEYTNRRTV